MGEQFLGEREKNIAFNDATTKQIELTRTAIPKFNQIHSQVTSFSNCAPMQLPSLTFIFGNYFDELK